MSGALAGALAAIDQVAEEGDLDAKAASLPSIEKDNAGRALELPDGKIIYLPSVAGEPIDELACKLMDTDHPARSRYLRMTGPPGVGKSQLGRAIALRLWTDRGRKVEERHGQPFYGYVELSGGPSSDEYLFRHEFVPSDTDAGQVRLVDSAFVTAMRNGWTVMIDEPNTIRDVALLSLNAVFDGRLSLYLPATGETVVAAPGFCAILAYNPGLVSSTSTDLPEAWYSRFPAALEVTSNWAALCALGAAESLVAAAMRLDHQRLAGEDGLVWTPQFREIEALTDMMGRVGERHGIALFVSSLVERVSAGSIDAAEAAATCRMLDEAGYAHYKVSATGRIPNLEGYPRAVTS